MRLPYIFLALSIFINAFVACGMAKRVYKKPERLERLKAYEPCKDFYWKSRAKKEKIIIENPIGKLCNTTCKNPKDKKSCNEYKVLVKDFKSPEVFYWFRAGGFIMVNEGLVL